MYYRPKVALMTPALMLFAALAGSALSLAGGPPSFTFQAPEGSGKRNASSPVLIVHAFSCHVPTDAPLSAHAEGIVGGERRTIPLKLEKAGETGVYTVARQWPTDGSWALVFSLDRGGRTTAMVKLDSKGVPVFDAGSSGQLATSSVSTISGAAKERDIESVLMTKLMR
jgi:hypothetical protein